MTTVHSSVSSAQKCASPGCEGLVHSVQALHRGFWKIFGECVVCKAIQERFCCNGRCENLSRYEFEKPLPKELKTVRLEDALDRVLLSLETLDISKT